MLDFVFSNKMNSFKYSVSGINQSVCKTKSYLALLPKTL